MKTKDCGHLDTLSFYVSVGINSHAHLNWKGQHLAIGKAFVSN